ncbi:MAG: 3-isopropylmalate dehydratase large subunit, partial [Chloroflexi bacterium]|nr:3-isopropylmalate dehydratase large subunit [Chloroflexota bacterium]
MPPKTMFQKIWDAHIVHEEAGKPTLLYVDLHLVHEVTSPQAFEGMREASRTVRRPDLTVAVADHNVPTTGDRSKTIVLDDAVSAAQLDAMERNASEFGVEYYDMYSQDQGIVHIIGPEQGRTQPGMIIVCGDSHTSTHGAFGAIAMPVGTSQVEHVLATQCLVQAPLKTMEIRVNGTLPPRLTAKDIILGIIGEIGVDGAQGYAVEYTGEAIRALSMEGRLTVCNMSIEAGARVGMVAPDETTFEYLRGRRHAPQGAAFDEAVARWRELPTDPGARYDAVVEIDASSLAPSVTWGTNPGMVVPVTGRVPDPSTLGSPAEIAAAERALTYMG